MVIVLSNRDCLVYLWLYNRSYNNMKKQTETIKVEINMDHWGFYHNDEHFGNEHKPYRDWVVKKTGIKWKNYSSGMWTSDQELMDEWIRETNQPYDTLYCDEGMGGIYLVDKNWNKKVLKELI